MLQDIMRKINEVHGQATSSETQTSSRRQSWRTTLTNLPKRDDVQWMKHTISRLNAKHVEGAKDVLEHREAHL